MRERQASSSHASSPKRTNPAKVKRAAAHPQRPGQACQAAPGEYVPLVNRSKCEGKGQCGACHIYVHEGRKSLSKIQRAENEKLDTIVGVSSKSRLACQTTMGEEPVTIELLSFV